MNAKLSFSLCFGIFVSFSQAIGGEQGPLDSLLEKCLSNRIGAQKVEDERAAVVARIQAEILAPDFEHGEDELVISALNYIDSSSRSLEAAFNETNKRIRVGLNDMIYLTLQDKWIKLSEKTNDFFELLKLSIQHPNNRIGIILLEWQLSRLSSEEQYLKHADLLLAVKGTRAWPELSVQAQERFGWTPEEFARRIFEISQDHRVESDDTSSGLQRRVYSNPRMQVAGSVLSSVIQSELEPFVNREWLEVLFFAVFELKNEAAEKCLIDLFNTRAQEMMGFQAVREIADQYRSFPEWFERKVSQ